ncbi:S26 family signal peptidase (plasmid) [Streptomyces sp. NBC_01340]|uniref:S26 family signal peptidase n=1 Tax=unclassified Streptomyces TaxID=2593676 RepID=UPI002258D662|nr:MULTISPECIES: S26 family signal peptidase [unclassified Streptomyces]MCX4597650.1 S26 family signal peptidase [Streptomyces sp. NBC_01549]WSI44887.1 S26 family signal peptidase [Streptomyces sp. NBC_01340]
MIADHASVVAAALTRRLVAVTVDGVSMEPTFRDRDQVLVIRGTKPEVGRVVVVESPFGTRGWRQRPLVAKAAPSLVARRRWMIKRVVALPGDPVPSCGIPALADVSGERVPDGMAVLLGDNSSASFDSREFGYFPLERILGVVRLPRRSRTGCGRRPERLND